MSGFGILMIIFGVALVLVGIYMFTGHKIEILTGRVAFKNLTINEWKKVGKYVIIVGIIILVIGIVGILLKI